MRGRDEHFVQSAAARVAAERRRAARQRSAECVAGIPIGFDPETRSQTVQLSNGGLLHGVQPTGSADGVGQLAPLFVGGGQRPRQQTRESCWCPHPLTQEMVVRRRGGPAPIVIIFDRDTSDATDTPNEYGIGGHVQSPIIEALEIVPAPEENEDGVLEPVPPPVPNDDPDVGPIVAKPVFFISKLGKKPNEWIAGAYQENVGLRISYPNPDPATAAETPRLYATVNQQDWPSHIHHWRGGGWMNSDVVQNDLDQNLIENGPDVTKSGNTTTTEFYEESFGRATAFSTYFDDIQRHEGAWGNYNTTKTKTIVSDNGMGGPATCDWPPLDCPPPTEPITPMKPCEPEPPTHIVTRWYEHAEPFRSSGDFSPGFLATLSISTQNLFDRYDFRGTSKISKVSFKANGQPYTAAEGYWYWQFSREEEVYSERPKCWERGTPPPPCVQPPKDCPDDPTPPPDATVTYEREVSERQVIELPEVRITPTGIIRPYYLDTEYYFKWSGTSDVGAPGDSIEDLPFDVGWARQKVNKWTALVVSADGKEAIIQHEHRDTLVDPLPPPDPVTGLYDYPETTKDYYYCNEELAAIDIAAIEAETSDNTLPQLDAAYIEKILDVPIDEGLASNAPPEEDPVEGEDPPPEEEEPARPPEPDEWNGLRPKILDLKDGILYAIDSTTTDPSSKKVKMQVTAYPVYPPDAVNGPDGLPLHPDGIVKKYTVHSLQIPPVAEGDPAIHERHWHSFYPPTVASSTLLKTEAVPLSEYGDDEEIPEDDRSPEILENPAKRPSLDPPES